eukprot:TRINITY_DN6389_c0_g1_i1.p1 TRINITY_DN6389_c0_g1~~TRINITY_DN6389_c0_g1_i1.p1  ORF type:complete len:353 (-),score=131.45 TRINITY_DN6389_c0_g1_i1:71-1084(-)
MSDVPEGAPEECPGTKSEMAGKGAPCAGCPNQKICASGATRKADPDLPRIQEKLSTVQNAILVLSGKGGVGKSTFSTQLSIALAKILLETEEPSADSSSSSQDPDSLPSQDVGLLDIDICGPSIPTITGLERQEVHMSAEGWTPVYLTDNLAVMSVGFMLKSQDEAVVWKGPKKNGLIKQFLRDVDWGPLRYLVVDTPPGTSDEHLSITEYLKPASPSQAGRTYAVIVTTPQEVSLLDVRKEINFCRKVNVPILGIVENMSGFVCSKCKTTTEIFKPTTGGGEKLAQDEGLRFLGRIPLDPNLARACDEGQNFLELFPLSPAFASITAIVQQIRSLI